MAYDCREGGFEACDFVVVSSNCYLRDLNFVRVSGVLPILVVLLSQSLLNQFFDLHERALVRSSDAVLDVHHHFFVTVFDL